LSSWRKNHTNWEISKTLLIMELINNIVKAYRVYSNLAGTHERIDLYMKMKECRVIRKENIGVTLIYS